MEEEVDLMRSRKTVRFAAAALAAPMAIGLVVAPAAQAASAGVPAKSYTAAQVKKHNKATDCWTIVGRGVYNVTGWINKHPGGAAPIRALCGKNGSASFGGVHGSDPIAKASLAKMKVGTLA